MSTILNTQHKNTRALIKILQITPWQEWNPHFSETTINQALSGISDEFKKSETLLDTAVLKNYFNFIDAYLRKGHTLTSKQATNFKLQIQTASDRLFSNAEPLDKNTFSIAENILVGLDYLTTKPYQKPLAASELKILQQTLQKINHTPDFFNLEKNREELTFAFSRLFGRYLSQSALPTIEKANAINIIVKDFLALNTKQMQSAQSSEEAAYAKEMGFAFMTRVHQPISYSYFTEESNILDLYTVRKQFDHHAQFLLNASQTQLLNNASNEKVTTQALQTLKENFYLEYLQYVYTEDELRSMQAGTSPRSLFKPQDIQIVSTKEAYPIQKILHIQSTHSEHPPLEVELNYHTLTEAQLKDTSTKLAQTYQNFMQSWVNSHMPKSATEGPIKIRMYVADNQGQYQRFDKLLGYRSDNGGYTLPTWGKDAYHANTYVYQEKEDNKNWHIRNAEHELTHGLSYYFLGKEALNLKFPAFVEGLAEYHAHEKDCDHKLDFVKKTTEIPDLNKIIKMGYSKGEKTYHLGHLIISYMVEKNYQKRGDIIKAFQSQDSVGVETLLQEFAQTEQAGFSEWIQELQTRATQKCSVGLFNQDEKGESAPLNTSNNIIQIRSVNTPPQDIIYAQPKMTKKALFDSLIKALNQYKPDLITIEQLLKLGAPVTVPKDVSANHTPLNYTVSRELLPNEACIELVNLLFKYGAPVDSYALESVARSENLELKSLLENQKAHSEDLKSPRRIERSVQIPTETHSNATAITAQTKLYNRLSKAVRKNLLTEVQRLIKQGAPLSDPAANPGFTPLHYAVKVAKKYADSEDNQAKEMNRKIIKQLLNAGAPIDYKNQDGRSAIDVATNNKLYTLAEELKKKSLMLINLTTPTGLVTASDATLPLSSKVNVQLQNSTQSINQAQPLLERQNQRARRNVIPQEALQREDRPPSLTLWQTAQQALIGGDYQQFLSLIPQLGSHITYTDDKGQNLFHYAAAYGNRATFNALTEQLRSYTRQGGSVYTTLGNNLRDTQPTEECFYYYLSVPDKRGNTPLHFAAQKANDSTLRSLLTYGVNQTPPENQAGKTPRQMAEKNPRLIPLFVHARNAHDIHHALSSNRIDEALALIEKCTLDRTGQSFEGWHTIGGHFYGPIGEALRQERILNAPHYNSFSNQWHPEKQGLLGKFTIGTSLLHHAANYQWVPASAIDALVKKGIPIDIPDQAGDTPLHFAIAAGNKTAIRSLIGHGATLDTKNHAGETPIDLAKNDQYRNEILQIQLQTSSASQYRMG